METLNFKIHQTYISKPSDRFDWTAIPDDYEPGIPIGCGRSIEEAIDDLLESWESKYNVQPTSYKWS